MARNLEDHDLDAVFRAAWIRDDQGNSCWVNVDGIVSDRVSVSCGGNQKALEIHIAGI